MDKLRIYLDTSVISYLDQQDSPERMVDTQEVWKLLKNNEYEVIISDLVLQEIKDASDEKKEILLEYLAEIKYVKCEITKEIYELANLIIDEGILKPKSLDDATHIAAAIYSNANLILSWNFKHLVNYNTINGVRQICFKKNLNRIIDICSPYVLLDNEKEDDEK